MYAVAGRWVLDPGKRELQERVLHGQIVPMVKATPGFLSGHWSRGADGAEHVTFILFEDRASAEDFAAVVKSDPLGRAEAGVESDWLTITEIIASA